MKSDQPSARFGRRGRGEPHPALSNPSIGWSRIYPAGIFGLCGLFLVIAVAIFWTLTGIVKQNAEIARSEQRVTEIVNQPVTHLSRSGPVTVFSPGWFHAGAVKPDFSNADIRTTQEFPYHGHVTSDVTPSEMFDGSELEFNAATKYFYVDRALPKKRLSGAEMIEINGLYRIIGRNESAATARWLTMAGLIVVGLCLAFALLMWVRRDRGPAAA